MQINPCLTHCIHVACSLFLHAFICCALLYSLCDIIHLTLFCLSGSLCLSSCFPYLFFFLWEEFLMECLLWHFGVTMERYFMTKWNTLEPFTSQPGCAMLDFYGSVRFRKCSRNFINWLWYAILIIAIRRQCECHREIIYNRTEFCDFPLFVPVTAVGKVRRFKRGI